MASDCNSAVTDLGYLMNTEIGTEISKQLQFLDDFLTSEAVDIDAMLLTELDGFLAGVAVLPEAVPPQEWLPEIWGYADPEFESPAQMQQVMGAILEHAANIARSLDQGSYRPIYDYDVDDTPLWEIWVSGFRKAIGLRPDAWQAFVDQEDDEELHRSLFVLWRLSRMEEVETDKPEFAEIDEELETLAPDVIPSLVEIVRKARRRKGVRDSVAPLAGDAKIGRNDPCPCGSGKKYKKCCLSR